MEADYYFYLIKNKAENLYKKFSGKRIIPKKIAGRPVLDASSVNKDIFNKIIDGSPFFAGRYGGFEIQAVAEYLKAVSKRNEMNKNSTTIDYLIMNAGFFPREPQYLKQFAQLMLSSGRNVDVLGRWWNGLEDYVIKNYATNAVLTNLLFLDPWYTDIQLPWSAALKGKDVLVIHPFINTIEEQYKKRETIFPNTNILPEFQLKTLKAVQTAGGQTDDRFETWFDALEYMFEEAMKIQFDIAILGCGAYGFPLAEKFKLAGKQAIHLGGSTQLLFGIKGRRWEENEEFAYVQKWFNSNWVYPSLEETPQKAIKIEGGCYWGE